MTWIRLDDGFISHPKTLSLPHKSIVLHIAGLTYCAMQLTDGKIPKSAIVLVLAQARVTKASMEPLLSLKMWRDQGDHYVIHDYLKYQESRETVLTRRDKWAESKRHKRGSSKGESDGESTADTWQDSNVESAHPIPSPPIPLTGLSHSESDLSPSTLLHPAPAGLGELIEAHFPRMDDIA
jgi:hypothetical protein